MSKHLIDFIGISKSYDSNLVLDDLNLYIRENVSSDSERKPGGNQP